MRNIYTYTDLARKLIGKASHVETILDSEVPKRVSENTACVKPAVSIQGHLLSVYPKVVLFCPEEIVLLRRKATTKHT